MLIWLLGQLSILYCRLMPFQYLTVENAESWFHFFNRRGFFAISFRLADLFSLRQPNEHVYYYLRAIVFCQNGQFEDGVEDITNAIEISPRTSEYWIFRARIYKELAHYEAAIHDLEQSIHYQKQGYPAIQWFEMGMNQLSLHKEEEALQAFLAAIKDETLAIPAYYYRLAQAYDRLMERELAQQYLEHSVNMNFQIEDQIANEQPTVYDQTQYTLVDISEFLVESYQLGMYVPTLAKFYLADQQYEKALAFINRALLHLPDHHLLHVERGKSHRLLEKHEDALQDFNKALNYGFDLALIYVERAHLWRLMGEEEKALADFLAAKEIEEDAPYLDYWIAGSFVVLEQLEEAKDAFTRAISVDPEDVDCYLERAEVYESLGEIKAAENDYNHAISLQDRDETRMKRAMFYWRVDRNEEALVDIQTAYEQNNQLTDNHLFCYVRGMIFLDIENYKLAELDFTRAIELNPESAILHERRARCRIQLERIVDALADCPFGLELNPAFDGLLWTRGYILYQIGDYLGAVRDTLEYLRLNPEDTAANYNLALIYMNLYEYKNALAQLSLAIARNPYYADAYYQRAFVWEKLLDFDRVSVDLANWSFYSRTDVSYEKRVEQIKELDSFDEMIIEDAIAHLKKMYGQDSPNLLH